MKAKTWSWSSSIFRFFVRRRFTGLAVGGLALVLAGPANAAAPANNDFANAQLIAGASGSIAGSNVSATKQSGEPDHAGNSGGRSVWYRWQANCTGTLTLDTPGVAFNTLLAVYTGTSLNSLVQVATNVHGPVTFSLTPGQVYQIAIDGSNGVSGSFTLTWNHAFNGTNGPDLTIWPPSTVPYIVKQFFSATDPSKGSCEVQEGCVVAGDRRLLRFALETRNIGNEDLVFGDPVNSPFFKFAACHNHYHFAGFATYSLLDSNNAVVAVGNKNGFCLEDYQQWNPLAHPEFYNCSYQGIQTGWSDIYTSVLPCQYIDITGVLPGNYTLQLEIDTLNRIVERDKTNNKLLVPVSIYPDCSSPPPNDNFTAAQLITDRITTIFGTNGCATKQMNERVIAGNGGGRSLWYRWTAPYTGSAVVSTEGTDFDTLLAVYTGSSFSTLVTVGFNDDIDGNTGIRQSRVSFHCNSGTSYKIAVDGYDGQAGTIQFNLNPAANDNFVNCLQLGGTNGTITGYSPPATANTNDSPAATEEAGEPQHAGLPGDHSLWYCWTAPQNGLATFDTVGTAFNPFLAVYLGADVAALTPLASDDGSAGNQQARVMFFAASNQTYRIALDSLAGDYGFLTLNWSMTDAPQLPIIVTQPEPVITIVGSNATFSVSVVGSAPLVYQWNRNGTPLIEGGRITGAGAATLTISNVQPADRGLYQASITNSSGTTNSLQVNLVVTDPSRVLHVEGVTCAPGEPVNVPVRIEAKGDEHAIQFSLSFDQTILSSPQALAGSGLPVGTTLTTDNSQAGSGRLGISLTLPAGQVLAAASLELIKLRVSIAGGITQPVSSPLCFSDDPVARDLFEVGGAPLSATYACENLTVKPGYEGDVDPRPEGDGAVTAADVLQVGRFALGIDAIQTGYEFLHADCAPLATLGDGAVTVIDWVQAGRFAAGLDVLVPIGGPFETTSPVLLTAGAGMRMVRAKGGPMQRGLNNAVSVELEAQGDENALGFSLNFDPATLGYKAVVAGSDAAGAALLVNVNEVAQGRLGIGVAQAAGTTFAPGTRQLVTVTFTAASVSSNVTTVIALGDAPTFREVASATAVALPANYVEATAGFIDLLSGQMLEDGRYQIVLHGVLGRTYELQTSLDLVHWDTLTNIVNLTGIIQFTDDAATNYTARFYKAVSP